MMVPFSGSKQLSMTRVQPGDQCSQWTSKLGPPKSNGQCSAKQFAGVPFRGLTLVMQQKSIKILNRSSSTFQNTSDFSHFTQALMAAPPIAQNQGATCRASPTRADKISTLMVNPPRDATNPILVWIWGFPKSWGYPKNGWFMMENPI